MLQRIHLVLAGGCGGFFSQVVGHTGRNLELQAPHFANVSASAKPFLRLPPVTSPVTGSFDRQSKLQSSQCRMLATSEES